MARVGTTPFSLRAIALADSFSVRAFAAGPPFNNSAIIIS
jgi:hypothetical protein